jgi:hypothetical protein
MRLVAMTALTAPRHLRRALNLCGCGGVGVVLVGMKGEGGLVLVGALMFCVCVCVCGGGGGGRGVGRWVLMRGQRECCALGDVVLCSLSVQESAAHTWNDVCI